MPSPLPVQLPATPLEWGAVGGAYLLGSVPFGLVLARVLKGIDLRAMGSGNIGTTNTMRALGLYWGLFVFVLDFGKGWLPVFLFAPLAATGGEGVSSLRLFCGAAAVLGHCFPLYLGFKGGKGVATGCGAIVGFDPLVFLLGGLVWLATLGLTRFVGLSSMLLGVSFPLFTYWLHPGETAFVLGACLLTLLILIRHRSNIGRMLAGKEPRMGSKGSRPSTTTHG